MGAVRMNENKVNILCLKWGTYYGPEYVNRLYAGVKRNLSRPFRFVCVTDDPAGLNDGIEAVPFSSPPANWPRTWPHIYAKLSVFRDGFADLKGPTLFLDIDQIITGDLNRFFDFNPGGFCMIHNWIELRKRIFRKPPKIGNSSCFRFEAGKMNHVYEKFVSEMKKALDKRLFNTEQAFMTYAVGLENITWWPSAWVKSFKRSCQRMFPLNLVLKPKQVDASIICFHGRPDLPQAINGYRSTEKKCVKLHNVCKPTKWILDYWHE